MTSLTHFTDLRRFSCHLCLYHFCSATPCYIHALDSLPTDTQWKALPKEQKEKYELKARRLMEENVLKQAEADRALNESLAAQSSANAADNTMSPRPAGPGNHSNPL